MRINHLYNCYMDLPFAKYKETLCPCLTAMQVRESKTLDCKSHNWKLKSLYLDLTRRPTMHDFWDPCWPLHLAPLPAGHEGYTGHALVNDNGNTGSLGPELFTYSQSTHPELFSQTPTYDLHGPVEPMLELPPSHKRIQYGASPDFTCGKTTASQRTSVIAQAAGDTSSDLCSGQWCQPNFLGYAQRVSIADTIAGTPTLVDVKGSTRLQKRAGSRHSRQIRLVICLSISSQLSNFLA